MNHIPKLGPSDQMTVEEFLAFTLTRPDEERWELIEGVPVLNASPVKSHQLIVANLISLLHQEKLRTGASWLALLGVGTAVPASPSSLPQPDLYIQAGGITGDVPVTDDALVIFEVLSRSNTRADRAWRRRVYASVPNCAHYVTVSLKTADVTVFDRASGWQERTAQGLDARIELAAVGVTLALADIYRWTPLAG